VIEDLAGVGGSGGLIAVDAAGNVALPFNSNGMYRGKVGADGVALTAIWGASGSLLQEPTGWTRASAP
jgi:isoaspartyl peptidase/L-asparaginase-like protein (Ntn-hydrolase superfamily)